jgi:hypothetical protein
LKGRLIDAITKLKKKVTELDEPGVEEAPKQEPVEGEVPKSRIMPNLGME